MSFQLLIAILFKSDFLAQSIQKGLGRDRYKIAAFSLKEEFCKFIEQEKQQLDCLLLEADAELPHLTKWLHGQATLLPAVLIQPNGAVIQPILPSESTGRLNSDPAFIYHTAEVRLPLAQLDRVAQSIDNAIAQFLTLSPVRQTNSSVLDADLTHDLTTQNFLLLQQRRLTEKLKERLGYLGVYYKRNPQSFFRHLSLQEQQKLSDRLKSDYHDIVLRYFSDDGTLNQRIDDFVNTAFFADIAVSQVVEAHMELMDEFSKQLKLEGRSEEILLDYRLTLIDTLAHLCEMYRRSVPKDS
ncbi:circadian clock protein KaiA [Leptolyngbya sp. FACHB-36]|uniref:circadian clock protein KaiA n=1 Tax=Leptolyngbya sp. FACHB-36 TaxID=2692808 RepID=UPI0016803FF9|nr:circadian clock protein KaiA [Leptolyngbya sp. FACHB-36]MBD2020464.1 circadian clock protein KaiA [Leptolyngbya sp. FACHB-36]